LAPRLRVISRPSAVSSIGARLATAVVYCEADFGAIDGKTANGLVRHSEMYDIVAVIDSHRAGLDSGSCSTTNPTPRAGYGLPRPRGTDRIDDHRGQQ
jgi:hypothetical protein